MYTVSNNAQKTRSSVDRVGQGQGRAQAGRRGRGPRGRRANAKNLTRADALARDEGKGARLSRRIELGEQAILQPFASAFAPVDTRFGDVFLAPCPTK